MERHDPSEVQPGDVVTLERGTPDEPGHETLAARVTEGREPVAYTCSLGWLRGRAMYEGWKIARITRPAPPIPDEPIPDEPGERFWGNWHGQMLEFIVTDEQSALVLDGSGTLLSFPVIRDHCTVVPAPEPETVPVPADLIREAGDRIDRGSAPGGRSSWAILRDIVRAVREREAGDE